MAWSLRGTQIECCNCQPGCSCNFTSLPNSVEGNCEAVTASVIERGHLEDVDLTGCRVAWALWWPGAIHDKGGRGHAFVDCESDAQFEALSRIWRGEVGYAFFEIFNSTFDEPTAVQRATVNVDPDGKRSSFSVEGVLEAAVEPLTSPVSGDEVHVRLVKKNGFIWKDGEIAKATFRSDLPGIAFDHEERHAVVAPFEWSAD